MTDQVRSLDKDEIQRLLHNAFAEDLKHGDLTAELLPHDSHLDAYLLLREPAVIAGQSLFTAAFHALDSTIEVEWLIKEGETGGANQRLATVRGPARAILSAERSALNLLQTLSGTATTTRRYVDAVAHTRCRILDTRKTLPGLRLAQKYAVTVGGGWNHRIGLYDGILIKENHIAAAGSVAAAVKAALKHSGKISLIEVEVETMTQLAEAIDAGATRIMLDNFSIEGMREAVAFNADRSELEASGNVTLDNVAEIAETGVDFISIGALTKHLRAIDFSLRYAA